ncbi:MAG: alpha/beta fold hydrolase [Gammaproteobacteria bacterium]
MSVVAEHMTNPEIARSVVAGGYATNYHDLGQTAPGQCPVLLLHGSGPGVTAWANWRLNLPVLALGRRVIAPDLLGFGYSDAPSDGIYGMDRWVEHLIAFLDALDLDRVDLVGNSFGGGLALNLALRAPERVRRLVLMGSVAQSFPITPGLDAVWGYEPSLEAMRGLLDIFAHSRALVTDELAELRFRASTREGVQERFAAMFPPPRQRWVDEMAVSAEQLADLPHECLVIHGREDQVIPPSVSQELFALLPHAQLHMFGECGHWVQIEHTDRFNQLVSNFLAEA